MEGWRGEALELELLKTGHHPTMRQVSLLHFQTGGDLSPTIPTEHSISFSLVARHFCTFDHARVVVCFTVW